MADQLIKVSSGDGRALGVAQWGDVNGSAVFVLHGTPGSRLGRPPDEEALRAINARVITYDRPGYGASDRQPGRRVVDCVGDVEAIADALGLDRFAVTGGSGGGPHALAVAARLPERVVRAESLVGAAPFDAPGFDWLAGMDPENVTEFSWAVQGEKILHPELAAQARADLVRVEADPAAVLSEDWQLDASDRQVLARSDVKAVMSEMIREAYRTGVWGWVDDDLALIAPWGFDVSEIRVPVTVRYGLKDVLVPAAHGAWLAANVPDAEVIVDDEAGHLVDPETRVRQLAHLIGAA